LGKKDKNGLKKLEILNCFMCFNVLQNYNNIKINMLAQTESQKTLCPCGEPLIDGRCTFCNPMPNYETDLNQFRTLVRKFHAAIAWGISLVKKDKWPPAEQKISDYFSKVENPLEIEYQRLLTKGYACKQLWEIMGRVKIE